jgi:hypothetical protein
MRPPPAESSAAFRIVGSCLLCFVWMRGSNDGVSNHTIFGGLPLLSPVHCFTFLDSSVSGWHSRLVPPRQPLQYQSNDLIPWRTDWSIRRGIQYAQRTGGVAAVNHKMETKLTMCICINCARVINCSAYQFVETKHNQPHIADTTTFTPRDGSPTIHVNVRTDRSDNHEMDRIWREHSDETRRAQEKDQKQASTRNSKNDDIPIPTGHEPTLHGESIYSLTPVTTLEYDVVACADYMEEMGCWVRNMPDEIKRANPHFVPT